MTALTRRRSDNSHRETWHIYLDDVRIGMIGLAAGVPTRSPQWKWSLGFYPGSEHGMERGGSAQSFEAARAAFDRAWQQLEPELTEAHFERWRQDRDFHAWKRRMWAEGCRLPTENPDGRSRCFCGAEISIACEAHIKAAHRGIGGKN